MEEIDPHAAQKFVPRRGTQKHTHIFFQSSKRTFESTRAPLPSHRIQHIVCRQEGRNALVSLQSGFPCHLLLRNVLDTKPTLTWPGQGEGHVSTEAPFTAGGGGAFGCMWALNGEVWRGSFEMPEASWNPLGRCLATKNSCRITYPSLDQSQWRIGGGMLARRCKSYI